MEQATKRVRKSPTEPIKVRQPERLVASLKALPFDEKINVLSQLKEMVTEQGKEMQESAQATLDKIKAAGL
jgi:hypothetical protein